MENINFILILVAIGLFNCNINVSGALLNSGSIRNTQDVDKSENTINDEPPPIKDYAKTARYLVHRSEWMSMGTFSTHPALKGFPMVNIISIADSARNSSSTGDIYFYLTMKDFTAQDLSKNNRLTGMLSLDQDLYCSNKSIDPMEPTCSRVIISGSVKILKNNADNDYEFGKTAMISRHPAVINWINAQDHKFFLCKLNIQEIIVLDYYGGPKFVTVDDYYKSNLDYDFLHRLEGSNTIDDYLKNLKIKDINIKFNNKKLNTLNINFN